MGLWWLYPLVNIPKAIENGPVEIVDLPSYKWVDLSIVMWLFTRGYPQIIHVFFGIFHDVPWNQPSSYWVPHRTNHEPPILWAVKFGYPIGRSHLIHSCCSVRDLSAAWESIPAVRKGADRRIMTIQREMWCWLVVSNMKFDCPFHIWDVILPIDELHHFSRWLLHHQPGWNVYQEVNNLC